MKLHSAAFERAVRRKVKTAVRAEPRLKRESKRNRFRKNYSIGLPSRAMVSGILGLMVWTAGTEAYFQARLALITLWAGAFVCIEAGNLVTCLYTSQNLAALTLLPLKETEIFRWQLQRFFRISLWLLLDLTVAYQVVALQSCGTILAAVAAIFAGVFTWAVALALAAQLAMRWPRLPYGLAGTLLYCLCFAELVARQLIWTPTIELAHRFGPVINTLLPTGWPATLLAFACGKTHWLFLLLLAPAGLLLAGVPSTIARLRGGYQFREPVPNPALLAFNEHTSSAQFPARLEDGVPVSEASTQLEDDARKQLRVPALPWNAAGRLENVLWNWLSARQKILAEFAFPQGVLIARRWYVVFRNVAITLLAAIICGRFSEVAEGVLLAAGAVITGFHVLFININTGGIFQSRITSGVQIPLFLAYPVTPRELGKFFIKVSIIQLPYTLAFAMVWAVVAAIFFEYPVSLSLLMGFKAGGLLFFSRYIFLAMAISSLSDDSRQLRLRSFIVLCLIVGLGLVFLGCGAASLFIPVYWIAWLCWTLSALAAWMFFKTYTWFYNRNWFDLIAIPGR